MAQLVLKVGRTYRGKRPRNCSGLVNDRTLVYVGAFQVQYDSPSVANGRQYPLIDREKFLEWVSHDCTDELPAGEYAQWPLPRKGKDE